ncbi:MAG: hypothetical protein GY862_04595 [Gammaproteobacteria bacterium]|nr:hypothetical protein [Gammaproteobacteria bacterium]
MTRQIRIAQVTDMHIGSTPAQTIHGIDVRRQFSRILLAVAKENPDLLILSGDLAADAGEPEAYAWYKQVLNGFHHAVVVMAGNHDKLETMRAAFSFADSDVNCGHLCFTRSLGGKKLIFLDTSAYCVDKPQLDWLCAEAAGTQEEVLLFMHHPPLLCDCRFMDNCHALRNIDEVWPVLQGISNISHIFCGHYHTQKLIARDGKSIYLTPSTMIQIDQRSLQFAIEHTCPGWRCIEWDDKEMRTSVHYLFQ